MKKNSLIFFIAFFLFISCGNDNFISLEELTNYINNEDNDFKYKKIINNVKYEIVYMPTDLLVCQELDNTRDLRRVKELRNQFNKYIYFNVSMSQNDKELLTGVVNDKSKFRQIVDDLAFRVNEKVIFSTSSKDTVDMIDFVYPRMYGMSNSTSFMLVYPRERIIQDSEYLNLTIKDLGFHSGDVKFKFNTKSILNEPQLRFE